MNRWITLSAILAVFLVAFIVLSIFRQLSQDLADFSFARSDSDAWTFAQVEVAYGRFHTAVQSGLIDVQTDGQLDPGSAAEIRKQFDLFYARLDTVTERYGMFPAPPKMMRSMKEVEAARDQLTTLIDANAFMTQEQLRELLSLLEEMYPGIRDFALQGVHASIEDQENERLRVYSSIRHTIVSLTTMVVLLFMFGAVLAYMWRKLAIKSIAEKNLITYLEKVVDASSDGILVADNMLRVIEVNHTIERILGCDRQALIGAHLISELGPKRYKAALKDKLWAMLDERRGDQRDVRDIRIIAWRRDGTSFPAELSVALVRDQARKKVLVVFVRDLTMQRQARRVSRRALADARREAAAKQRFLATMSHEMRTPLHSIIAVTEMAQGEDSTLNIANYLPIVKNAAENALQHVEDVLALAAHGPEWPSEEIEAFNAREIAKSVFLQMQPLARSQRTQLVFGWPNSVMVAAPRGYRQLLSKVIYNLVSNAIKATENGVVTFRGARENVCGQSILRLDISDNGIGISKSEQARIFDDFVSGFKASKNTTSGTGLGLGIVRRALKDMNGRIELESKPGQGSVFRVFIPLEGECHSMATRNSNAVASSEVFIEQPVPSRPASLEEGKVLVIEDHATNRHLLEAMLVKSGYSVTTAADGLEGLMIAAETAFDLVLTDLNMPRLSGDGVARCLRHSSVSGDACIIAVTAKTQIGDTYGASVSNGDIDAFLFKPFDSARLESVIRDALDEREQTSSQTSAIASKAGPNQPRRVEQESDASLRPSFVSQARQDMCDLLARMPAPDVVDAPSPALDDLGKAAHYVAGSLLVMGYHRLGRAVQDVERMCHEGDIENLRGMTVVLRLETERLFAAFANDTALA